MGATPRVREGEKGRAGRRPELRRGIRPLHLALGGLAALLGAAAGMAAPTTEVLYLSGRGPEDAVAWAFRCHAEGEREDWRTIPVPAQWDFHGCGRPDYGIDTAQSPEAGVYRRTIRVPESWRGRRVDLVFEGVMTDAEVLLDGQPLGHRHKGGFTPFRFRIDDRIGWGRIHELTVRVWEASREPSVERAEREGDYWLFGGIYRPVYLEARPLPGLYDLAVAAAGDGWLEVSAEISPGPERPDRLVAQVETLAGRAVGPPLGALVGPSPGPVQLRGLVPDVEPWSDETPRLYRLRVTLLAGARPLHELSERIGFRTVEVRPGEGLFVNGRRTLLRGVNRHTLRPDTGRATGPPTSRRDVALLRALHLNAVRTSHYPPDRHFLDACDEAGIWVVDELAGWGDAYGDSVGRRLAEAMVRRDRNHPSVLFWANGNEGGTNRRLDPVFQRLDPLRRPVIHPLHRRDEPGARPIDTRHYPSYDALTDRLAGDRDVLGRARERLVMPTEALHGLYDGGLGAGLGDFWDAIRRSPRGAGIFLWAFLDEGVERAGGGLDTAGNRGPDGLLDPYRRPEASFWSVRQTFAPVRVRAPDAAGTVVIENRLAQRGLEGSRLGWRLVTAELGRPAAVARERASGSLRLPAIPPGGAGRVALPLPEGWASASYLEMRVRRERSGAHQGSWSFPLTVSRSPSPPRPSAAQPVPDPSLLTLARGGTVARFSAATGELRELVVGERSWRVRRGPFPVILESSGEIGSDRSPAAGRIAVDGAAARLTVSHGTGLLRSSWQLEPDGSLLLDAELSLPRGAYETAGIGFDLTSPPVAVQWLGSGPAPVFRNRWPAGLFGLWSGVPDRRGPPVEVGGVTVRPPPPRGFLGDVRWARLRGADGTVDLEPLSGFSALQAFAASAPLDAGLAAAPAADADLAFLFVVPAVGSKFHPAVELGPAGRPAPGGTYRGRLRLAL